MEIEEIIDICSKGISVGLLFANVTILGGWGIRQLIIFFKRIIYGGF